MGGVVRRYIDIITIIINFPYSTCISSFLPAASLLLCSFLKCFLPYKIEHAFYSFTADHYKNWAVQYSIICFQGILSSVHLECWRHFVLACRYMCKLVLTQNDITIGDALLLKICSRTEALFGKSIITPNMHAATFENVLRIMAL